MKKLFFISVLCSAIFFSSNAQSVELIVKKGNQGLYLEHTVAAKEGLYSLGRLYNVHPRFLAAYNKIELAGLNIGQLIQVPLTDTNFTQKSPSGVPVYYVTEGTRVLTDVSNANNKVSQQKLREWNNLAGDNVIAGKKLVVGFLVSKEMTAYVANNAAAKTTPVVQQETLPANAAPANSPEPKAVKSEEKTQQPPVVTSDKALVKTEPVKPAATRQEPSTEPAFVKEDMGGGNVSEQGYFKKSFEQQVKAMPASKTETVTAGIFKTTSGWQDAKYYLLMDKVPSGTIVKITNPGNNKSIYAKVLGEMNGIRQNQGLNIRISNAAATALTIAESEKFIVQVHY
jgi:hypothetical protein